MDENILLPHGHPHGHHTIGIVTNNLSPAATAVVGARNARISDVLDISMHSHIIINTNTADGRVVALEQDMDNNLTIGAPLGAPSAINATPHTRTNTLTLNTQNINLQCKYHHHYGREVHVVLISSPLHLSNHSCNIPRPQAPTPIAMPANPNDAGTS